MAFGEGKILAIVVERSQVDVGRRVVGSQLEYSVIGGDRITMSIRIFLKCDAAREPGTDLVLVGDRLRPGPTDRCAGHNFLALGKIHQELSRDGLQQLAAMTEGDPTLRRGRSGCFQQRILQPGRLLPHRVEGLTNHVGPHTHRTQIANLFYFQQVGE